MPKVLSDLIHLGLPAFASLIGRGGHLKQDLRRICVHAGPRVPRAHAIVLLVLDVRLRATTQSTMNRVGGRWLPWAVEQWRSGAPIDAHPIKLSHIVGDAGVLPSIRIESF